MAVADYIKPLIRLRKELAQNLRTQGVDAEDTETFNTLVPKVLQTKGSAGVTFGEWITIVDTNTFTIEKIPFLPKKIAISSEHVLKNEFASTVNMTYISLMNIDDIDGTDETLLSEDNSITVSDIGAEVTFGGTEGNYTVTVSFANINEALEAPYFFKSGVAYSWVCSDDSWEV